MKHHRIRLCGVDCSVREVGEPSAPTLILLHGWLDNSASFDDLIDGLSQFRLLLVDFPGHGESEHLPAGMAYHFLDLVYVIQDVIQHFKLSSVNIVGHSMGGAAATLFASISDKVEKLVLIEALGPLTVSADETLALMQRSVTDREAISSKNMPVYKSVEQALKVRAAHSKMEPSTIRPIVDRGLKKVDGGFGWRSDSRLTIASINRLTEKQLEPLLTQIDCPVLLIEADKGMFSDRPLLQTRKQYLTNLKTEVLKGGHHVHMEKPEQTVNLINQFIAADRKAC